MTFNAGGCLIKGTAYIGLTVHRNINIIVRYYTNIVDYVHLTQHVTIFQYIVTVIGENK